MTEEEKEELVAVLTDEFLEQLRRDKRLTPESFAAEHPECADELLEVLPMLMEVEGVSRATTQPLMAAVATYPDSLGDYRLLDKLGSGGMGTVFRAMQESLQREVAVKILSPAWSSDERHCEAFANESRVIAGLRHTNIVEVFGAGQEENIRYYVMSLVKGQGVTPDAVHDIYRGVPYVKAVADVGLQAARALAYAHSRKVLHRDVKPGNLLLDEERVLHVSDFGLATVLNSGEAAPLVTQSQDGTLRYMAPERLLKGENSFAGDQYSLGLTLYELLTKRPAFREVEPGQLIHRICDAPVDRLREEGELGAIINKAVSYDPADRYPSMDAMADDLQRLLEGKPVKARPASLLRRYVMWFRRRPAVAVWSHAALLSVLLLFSSVSIAYVQGRMSLLRENEQRRQAERNAEIADTSMHRIFEGMTNRGLGNDTHTKEDTRLLQDLMPYYEEVARRSENGSGKMAAACMILADIAVQTADFVTAETYYHRAAESLPHDSAAYVDAVNGVARAMVAQNSDTKRQQAEKLLRKTVGQLKESPNAAVRRELVHSLLLLSAPLSGPGGTPSVRASLERRQLGGKAVPHARAAKPSKTAAAGEVTYRKDLLQAAALLKPLLEESPQDEELRLMQLELLRAVPGRAMADALGCTGMNYAGVLNGLLEKQPDSAAYRMAYIRMVIRPSQGTRDPYGLAEFSRAAVYAQSLLAENPTNADLLALYLAARDRTAAALEQGGETEKAAKEREKTLGVLALLIDRADFTTEMRERLVMLVSMLPNEASGKAQQEEEIALLLQSYDENRKQELRERLQRRRQEWHERRNKGQGGHLPVR